MGQRATSVIREVSGSQLPPITDSQAHTSRTRTPQTLMAPADGNESMQMEQSGADGGQEQRPEDIVSPTSAAVEVGPPAEKAEQAPLLVVVTGGSKGIGKSCVEAFAQRGARVLFTYCSDVAASKKVEQSFQPPGRVQARQLDQGDFDNVRAFAAEVDRWREGREISTVVNNAALGSATVTSYGGLPPPPPRAAGSDGDDGYAAARRQADEDMAMMRVNALGPMWVTEALLPMMMPPKAGGGGVASRNRAGTGTSAAATCEAAATAEPVDGGGGERARIFQPFPGSEEKKTVLFVGSVGGGSHAVFPGFRSADAMSKAAIAYGCKYFAAQNRQQRKQTAPVSAGQEAKDNGGQAAGVAPAAASSDFNGARVGVDFVCLCPGATLTDMFRASTLDKMEAKGPGELQRFLDALPQGRLMLPEEVGEAVFWLCSSPAATMFHGAVIDASAGLAVRPGVLTEYAF